MAKISTQIPLSTNRKVSGNRTTYADLVMTDASVYDMAVHWYTIEEIADRFKVTEETVLNLHGDAYHKGKAEHSMKPRILVGNMLDQLMDLDYTDPKIAAVHGPLATKLVEMQWKKKEGYGAKTEVQHTVKQVTAEDFKFDPLTLENKDSSWTK